MSHKVILFLLTLAACETAPDNDHVLAARMFTTSIASSRFSDWELNAIAAGRTCDVLLVQTSIIVDEKMVEALHYGGGEDDAYEGGVRHFCRDRGFRGVVYRDHSNQIWTYGDVSETEAKSIQPCH